MTGTTLDIIKHFKAELSAYCEVHEERQPTNTIDNACTHSAIFIGPTANFQGRYKFLYLKTGKRITRKKFSAVPMPVYVVKRVEKLATIDAQLDEDLTCEDHNNTPIEDANDTTKGSATAGVDIETPGLEIGIRTLVEENPNKNEKDTDTEHYIESVKENTWKKWQEIEGEAITGITPEVDTLETTGVTAEHTSQSIDDAKAIQTAKHKYIGEALPEDELLPEDEALLEDKVLPEDKGDGGEIEGEDVIPED